MHIRNLIVPASAAILISMTLSGCSLNLNDITTNINNLFPMQNIISNNNRQTKNVPQSYEEWTKRYGNSAPSTQSASAENDIERVTRAFMESGTNKKPAESGINKSKSERKNILNININKPKNSNNRIAENKNVHTGTSSKAVSNSNSRSSSKDITLTGLSGINYEFHDMPDYVMNYLKHRSKYSKYLDKKLVVYYGGINCPYGKAFQNAVEAAKSDPVLAKNYNYYQMNANKAGFSIYINDSRDFNANTYFMKRMHEFCIINPRRNQIFSINGVGDNEALKLKSILTQLRNW